MKFIEIAKVLKPQGIKGEVKAQHFCDNPDKFFEFEKLYIKENGKYTEKIISQVRVDHTHVYIYIHGVVTREDAEQLRGMMLYVEKSDIKQDDENAFLFIDLIGINIIDEDGENLGVLKEILQHGSVDIYCIKSKNNGFMFPALKRVIKKIDIKNKIMTLDKYALSEVAVYDD